MINNQLIEACKDGDLKQIKILVSQGADITTSDNFAVLCASGNGHSKTLEFLIKKLLSKNLLAVNEIKETIQPEHFTILKKILLKSQDIEKNNSHDYSNNDALGL